MDIGSGITNNAGVAFVRINDMVIRDGHDPDLLDAKITGPNQFTVTFSENVIATTNGFNDLRLSNETVNRTITDVTGTGTTTLVVSFDGDAVDTDATATVRINVTDSVGNAFGSHLELTIIPVHGASRPTCENTPSGCYIASTDSILVGGTVLFKNTDNVSHTFTSGTTQSGPNGVFDSGVVAPGSSFKFKAYATGEISYYCKIHPWMHRTIITSDAQTSLSDAQAPMLVSASITGPNEITAIFSESVTATTTDFDIIILPNDTRNITTISGSGTDTISILYDGNPTPTNATASLSLGSGIVDMDGNNLEAIDNHTATDGQAPRIIHTSISTSGTGNVADIGDDVIVVFSFSEEVGASLPTVKINGIKTGTPLLNDSGYIASRTISQDDSEGMVSFSISGYEDVVGNVAADITDTTDGSSTSIAFSEPPEPKTMISGVVFTDMNWNGIQDQGEEGMANYDRMIAMDYSNPGNFQSVVTGDDGSYSFEVTPGAVTLVQTHYYPSGYVVYDPFTSWYEYITPEQYENAKFDVGFHPVTESEQVYLEIQTFVDYNWNGIRDAGESGVSGLGENGNLTFYVYTYSIGPVAYPITNSEGVAVVDNLVPADFALLVDVDSLEEQGCYWTSTYLERGDDNSGKPYNQTYPVVDNPTPGSSHTMLVGLVPVS